MVMLWHHHVTHILPNPVESWGQRRTGAVSLSALAGVFRVSKRASGSVEAIEETHTQQKTSGVKPQRGEQTPWPPHPPTPRRSRCVALRSYTSLRLHRHAFVPLAAWWIISASQIIVAARRPPGDSAAASWRVMRVPPPPPSPTPHRPPTLEPLNNVQEIRFEQVELLCHMLNVLQLSPLMGSTQPVNGLHLERVQSVEIWKKVCNRID